MDFSKYNKKIPLISSLVIFSFILNGCGESGTCCSSSSSSSNASTSTTNSTSVEVTVERGAVYFATVKDSNNTTATYLSTNNNSGLSSIYTFDSEPVYPITVSGGYIDVNNDGKLDGNDTKLDINLTSYSKYVSTLTTLIDNNSSKKQYFMDTFNLTEDQLLNNIPTNINKDAVIASNAAFVILKKGYSFLSANFNNSISDQNTTYNTSFSAVTNLKTLNSNMENNIIDNNISNVSISRLTSSDIDTVKGLISSYFKVNETTLTNSTFTKNKTTSSLIEDIWNVAFSQATGGNYENFDIGVEITKLNSTKKVNILFDNISLVNGKLTTPSSIIIYGEDGAGGSSTKTYSSSNSSHTTLINGSVAYLQSLFGINLGYIINNQDMDASIKTSLTNAGTYYIKIYAEKINLGASNLPQNTSMQLLETSKVFTTADTQYISGTIVIK